MAVFAGAQIWRNCTQDRRTQEDRLRQRLADILALSVQYPYLEHPSITENWKGWKDGLGENVKKYDEKFARYDQFANIIFNFLEDVYIHFKGDKKKIEDFVDVKSWIRLHKQVWEDPLSSYENADSYSDDFRKFIDSYLK